MIDLDRVRFGGETIDMQEGVAAPGPSISFSDRSIEDIVEGVMGVEVPQRSERHQRMYEAAKAYYAALHGDKPSSANDIEALKQKLDELSSPFSEEIAYHAFLEMERLASGFGNSSDGAKEK